MASLFLPTKIMRKKIVEKISSELEPLTKSFMNNSYIDLEHLKNAYKSKDYKAVERLGHNIKGSALNYGFDLLAEIGKEIEKAALLKSDNEIEALFDRFEYYMKNVQVKYKD